MLKPLRMVNANFQSLKNKKLELHSLIDSSKPDILVITETWLDSESNMAEYFPESLNMSVYTRHRCETVPGKIGGGVLIAVSNDFISTPVPELETECEMKWIKIDLVGAKSLYVCGYYRPDEHDTDSIDKLEQSMSRICDSHKHHICHYLDCRRL